ncbi:unnamed protein product [Caenorhabditis bovis]|uniref:NSFL1 cofactor p47 n=1 Tax=Caenorhabditis bovis TaxID=2654633 RepID=A0A8S1F1Z6_9PELO|nr:unnamed protein product [Caenorhabditis bovis]
MSRNIRTFDDLNGESDHEGNGSDGESNNRRGQDFYVGSGQQVVGPNRNEEDIFRRIMETARSRGDIISQGQPGEAVPAPSASNESRPTAKLVIWKNGYTIDNGPLRNFDSPENAAVLNQILNGHIPPEMIRAYGSKAIDVAVEKKTIDYEQPKFSVFQGQGVRLGNVVPDIVGESSSGPVVPPASQDEQAKDLEKAKIELNLDNSQPTTNVQIRLPNNQRLVATFNHTHTLCAIRSFICTARPDLEYRPFQLMSAYPPKVFDDESISIKDADLLNSVVVVKQI